MIVKAKIIGILVVAVVLGLAFFVRFNSENLTDDTAQPTNTPEATLQSPSPSTGSTSSPRVSSGPSATPKANGYNKLPPAECELGGQVVFLSQTLSRNEDAAITYRHIDSVARHILWSIEPNADFAIGPNLFARLPLPNGKEDVSVNLGSGVPQAKKYYLSASVTYGVFNENINLEIKTAKCSGNIIIDLSQI